jgi:poly(3-hydroxybutyrate) depolymerase
VVHGEDDNVVNIKNSYELVKQWTDLHGTKQMPDSVIHSFANNSDVQKDIYLDRDGNAVIKFYRISNLGHALAVSPGSPVDKGGETGLFAVDKGFHSTYWIAVDFGLIEERKR